MNDTKKYNRDFIYTCPEKILFDPDMNLNKLRLYMMIRSFMDTTGVCYASNNWLAKKLNINRRNTINYINELIKKRYIERIHIDRERFLRIRINHIDESLLVSHSDTPQCRTATPPPVSHSDTQLDQSNIRSKNINRDINAREDEQNQNNEPSSPETQHEIESKTPNKQTENEMPIDLNFHYPETYFPMPSENATKPNHSLMTRFSNGGLTESMPEGFKRFWSSYPRQQNLNRALAQWIHDGCEQYADEIIKNLEDQKARDKAFKDGFVPNPFKYITEKRYLDEPFQCNKNKSYFDYKDTSWASSEYDDIFDKLD